MKEMKKKAIVYPFDKHFLPLLRNNEMLSEFQIVGLVSPNGWGYVGKDAGIIDCGKPINMIVTSNFEESLNECETVFFTKSDLQLDYRTYILPKMDLAISQGKNIVCTIDLSQTELDFYKEKCFKSDLNFEYCNNNLNKINSEELESLGALSSLEKISTPVIFVLGLMEQINKFDIQLWLNKYLENKGYRVSQIGSRSYCEILGFHSIPFFMFTKHIHEHEKVILFNNYLRRIEIDESPDVIVIGIPGGIIPINDKQTNKFGVTAYEISRAVTPDASVFCTYYDKFNDEYYKNMFELIKHRFAAQIDCCHMSNVKLDISTKDVYDTTTTVTVNLDEIEKGKKDYLGIPFFNIHNTDDKIKIGELIINNLSTYSGAEII